jgi:hypothetical protein
MTYLKMLSAGAKKHLIAVDQRLDEVTTLCGCTVTRRGNCKAVTALEGDECEKCASVSFSVTKLRDWLDNSDRASREAAMAKQAQ